MSLQADKSSSDKESNQEVYRGDDREDNGCLEQLKYYLFQLL